MVVIGSSALLDALLDDAIFQSLQSITQQHELVAPDHIDIECLHALRKLERLGHIPETQATALIGELARFRCSRIPIQPLLTEIWRLRNNFSAYDAAYVALALGTGSTLITHDMGLANAAITLVRTAQLIPAP